MEGGRVGEEGAGGWGIVRQEGISKGVREGRV